MADDADFFRKKPTQSRSRSVVNAIISATDQLLERSGDPTQLSLEGIARRAGVGIGSLYDYFANREGLLGALVARITEANFEALSREVAQTEGMPFDQALPVILEKTMDTYLSSPVRTRGIAAAIFRLGWLKPVVRERDRFAELLARRLLAEHPHLDAAQVRLTAEVLCDCAMGVVVTELWRERTPAQLAAAKAELLTVVRRHVAGLISG